MNEHGTTQRTTPRLALDHLEASEALGVCENTLRALVDERGLPVVRVGRRVLYPVDALRRWLNAEAEREAERAGGAA